MISFSPLDFLQAAVRPVTSILSVSSGLSTGTSPFLTKPILNFDGKFYISFLYFVYEDEPSDFENQLGGID